MFRTLNIVLLLLAVNYPVSAQTTQATQTTILTSIKPLALLVQQLAAPGDQIELLLPANSSPHHYQLKTSDRQRISAADVVIWIGPELESFLEKPLKQRQKPTLSIASLESLHWPHTQIHGHDQHAHTDRDPHVWLDPTNLAVITRALVVELSRNNPVNKAIYTSKGKKLLDELAALDQQLQQVLAPVTNQPFIVLHPAYNHFIERYGLQQLDYIGITPERGLSAKHAYALRQQASARCVFGEVGQDTKQAEVIARTLNVTMAVLDPLGVNISDNAQIADLLRNLAETIIGCLTPIGD
jgi:zinc transport system substrate-binding protein